MPKQLRLIFSFSISLSIVVAAWIVLPATKTNACAPGGDPWYIAHLNFDKVNLPNGLEIDSNYGDGYNEFAKIKNNSSTPFYLVEKNYTEKIFPGSELPKAYAPMYKMVSGKAYMYWTVAPEGYIENLGTELAKQWVLITNFALEANNIHPNIKYGDSRPANFTIPSSEPFTFLGFQNNKPVTLTGTVKYILNENYNPHAGQPCLDHLNKTKNENQKFINSESKFYILLLIVLFIIVIILFSSWKFKK